MHIYMDSNKHLYILIQKKPVFYFLIAAVSTFKKNSIYGNSITNYGIKVSRKSGVGGVWVFCIGKKVKSKALT